MQYGIIKVTAFSCPVCFLIFPYQKNGGVDRQKVLNEISLFMTILTHAVHLDRVYSLGTPSPWSLVSIYYLCLRRMSHSSLVLPLSSSAQLKLVVFLCVNCICIEQYICKRLKYFCTACFFLCNICTVTYWLFCRWPSSHINHQQQKSQRCQCFFQFVAKKDQATNQVPKLFILSPSHRSSTKGTMNDE